MARARLKINNLKNTELETDTKVLLFSRWLVMNYGTPEYDVNGYDGNWWKGTLEHFNKNVYPHLVKNGSVETTKEFLKSK